MSPLYTKCILVVTTQRDVKKCTKTKNETKWKNRGRVDGEVN